MGGTLCRSKKSEMVSPAKEIRLEVGGDIGSSVDGNTQRDHVADVLKYEMNNPKRGRFIIINNKDFDRSTKLHERTGTDVDATNLESVFKDLLKFEVVVNKNLTGLQMLQLMIAESRKDHSKCDCFAVAVLTHGEEGKLYGKDELVAIQSLVAPFKNCPSLAGKPKLFFFQACRGNMFDEGVKVLVESDSTDGENNVQSIPEQEEIVLPLEADFLFAYSTVSGYFSWRNGSQGSWFVQALTNQLRNFASTDIDLVRLLTRVSYQIAYEFELKSNDPAFKQKKQVPSIVSMLTKDLYFTKK